MMRTQSIWRDIGKNIGKNIRSRSNGTQRSKRINSRSFWSSASDAVIFRPTKDTVPWRDIYRLNRQIGDLERSLSQPARAAGTGIGSWVIRKLLDAWHELVDEIKALLTALAFHLLSLVLIIVFNIAFFGGLVWLAGWWLGE